MINYSVKDIGLGVLCESILNTLANTSRVITFDGDNAIIKYVHSMLPHVQDVVLGPMSNAEIIKHVLRNYRIDTRYRVNSNQIRRKFFSVYPVSTILPYELESLLTKVTLKAPAIEEVNLEYHNSVKDRKLHAQKPKERVMSDAHIIASLVEKQLLSRGGRRFLHYGLGTYDGVPASMLKGYDLYNSIKATRQLERIPDKIRANPSEIITATYDLLKRIGVHTHIPQGLRSPSYDEVIAEMLKYNTSTGITSHKSSYKSTTFHLKDGSRLNFGVTKRGKKSEFASTIATWIVELLKKLKNAESWGSIDPKIFGSFTAEVIDKVEFINLGDFIDMDEYIQKITDNPDELHGLEDIIRNAESKVRKFWNVSMYDFILNKLISSRIMSKTYGYQCAIGVSLTNGQFTDIFRQISKDPKYMSNKEKRKRIRKLYRKYPELKDAYYYALDWSKFDMGLSSLVLRILGATAITMLKEESGMLTSFQLLALAAKNASTFAYRLASIPALQADFSVSGGVASGHFGTSWVDSMYTMVLYEMYLNRVELRMLSEDLDNYKLFKLARELELFCIWVYGDDFIGRGLRNLNHVVNPKDFTDMCISEFGMKIKWIEGLNMEITTPISRVEYVRNEHGVWNLLIEDLKINFLKNYVAEVYHNIDGNKQYVGLYPYRKFGDLMGKTLVSLRSVSHPVLWGSALTSIAWLCQGNTEAYNCVKLMYCILRSKIDISEAQKRYVSRVAHDPSLIKQMPHSLRMLIMNGTDITEFPSLSKIRTESNRGEQFKQKAPKDWNYSQVESLLIETEPLISLDHIEKQVLRSYVMFGK